MRNTATEFENVTQFKRHVVSINFVNRHTEFRHVLLENSKKNALCCGKLKGNKIETFSF